MELTSKLMARKQIAIIYAGGVSPQAIATEFQIPLLEVEIQLAGVGKKFASHGLDRLRKAWPNLGPEHMRELELLHWLIDEARYAPFGSWRNMAQRAIRRIGLSSTFPHTAP